MKMKKWAPFFSASWMLVSPPVVDFVGEVGEGHPRRNHVLLIDVEVGLGLEENGGGRKAESEVKVDAKGVEASAEHLQDRKCVVVVAADFVYGFFD
jgi:hypothetical protein